MRSILIFIESRFPVNRKRVNELVNRFLDAEKIKGKMEIGISFVGDRKMRALNNQYRHLDQTTTVLAFALDEVNLNLEKKPSVGFIYPDDGVLRLGDVIVSYPQAVLRAAEDEMLVDDKIDELLLHGLNNLVGKGG